MYVAIKTHDNNLRVQEKVSNMGQKYVVQSYTE